MLALTKRTEYALIALHYMIEQGAIADDAKTFNGHPPASAREIAERYQMPLPLLMNILKKLSQENVLVSLRGAKGGYALAVDPRKMTLSRLIEVLEAPVCLVDCAVIRRDETGNVIQPDCKINGRCPIRNPLCSLHNKMVDFLASVTLHDICGRNGAPALIAENGAAVSIPAGM